MGSRGLNAIPASAAESRGEAGTTSSLEHPGSCGWRDSTCAPMPGGRGLYSLHLWITITLPNMLIWGWMSVYKALGDPCANTLGKYCIKGGCGFLAASQHKSPWEKTWERVLYPSPTGTACKTTVLKWLLGPSRFLINQNQLVSHWTSLPYDFEHMQDIAIKMTGPILLKRGKNEKARVGKKKIQWSQRICQG